MLVAEWALQTKICLNTNGLLQTFQNPMIRIYLLNITICFASAEF